MIPMMSHPMYDRSRPYAMKPYSGYYHNKTRQQKSPDVKNQLNGLKDMTVSPSLAESLKYMRREAANQIEPSSLVAE